MTDEDLWTIAENIVSKSKLPLNPAGLMVDLRRVRDAERERCARVCDAIANDDRNDTFVYPTACAEKCAAAIRRSEE